MTLQYDQNIASSYNQQLQSYQDKIGNGTITQSELNQAKELASQYYEYLSQSGVEYGSVATEVIQSSTFYGAYANGMLSNAIREKNPSASEDQINFQKDQVAISLALEDSYLRKNTSDGNLTSREIADYHYNVFATNSLPKEAWGGAIFEEFFGAESWIGARNNKVEFFIKIASAWYNTRTSDNFSNGISEKNSVDRIIDFSSGEFATGQGLENFATDLAQGIKNELNSLISDSHTISDHFQSYLDSFRSAETVVERRVDPLTLDLDGDGVELVNVNNSTAFFDLDVAANVDAEGNFDGTYTSDGVKEQVGWVSGDDGLLALDKNNNGAIDNILELFGKNNKTGTEELREYDLNNDGKIDSNDAIFSQLKVWQDVNQDGISQASELKSLTDLKITSINVAADSLTQINQTNNGNVITSKGSFTQSVTSTVVNADGTTSEVTSGVTKTYANLDLAVNQTNSVAYTYTDSEGNTIGNYNLNLDVLSAPMIRGYGNVDALPVAASKDSALLDLLQKLNDVGSNTVTASSSDSAYNYGNINSLVEKIIFQWSGAGAISASEMRGLFSSQKLTAMENLRGQTFLNAGGGNTVSNATQLGVVTNAWNALVSDIKTKLLVQSTFKDIFTVHGDQSSDGSVLQPAYDFSTDAVNFNGITLDQIMSNAASKLPAIVNSSSTATDAAVKGKINDIYSQVDKASFLSSVKEALNVLAAAQSKSSYPDESKIVNLSSANLESALQNVANNYFGNNVALGTSDGESLYGTNSDGQNLGNDIIYGAAGNDTLVGRSGDDVYIFNKGDGQDKIDEAGVGGFVYDSTLNYGNDTILMGEGITKENVYLVGNKNGFTIKFKDSLTDQIQLSYQSLSIDKIETILFSNGETIDLTDPNLVYYSPGAYGSDSSDIIQGTDGDDRIKAGDGNDTTIGGTGNDNLYGGEGDDTYVFNIGDGQDVIDEIPNPSVFDDGLSHGNDKIVLGAGLTKDDIYFQRSSSDLIVKFKNNSSDQILIKKQFTTANKIESIQFANGDIIDLTSDSEFKFQYFGTSGDDTIYGSDGPDAISGGVGNDNLHGGYGDDAYIFNLGDGKDVINESPSFTGGSVSFGSDAIQFGQGISRSDLTFSASGSNLVISFKNSPNDQITIQNQFNASLTVEKLKFYYDPNDPNVNPNDYVMDISKVSNIDLKYDGTSQNDDVDISRGGASATINTYDGNDTIFTNADRNVINSGSGNDNISVAYDPSLSSDVTQNSAVIDAGEGDDTITTTVASNHITGGKGNDTIYAYYGNNTYNYYAGDGADTITNYNSESSLNYSENIALHNINKSDVMFSYLNKDLTIKFGSNANDQITIKGQMGYKKVKSLQFDDGSSIDISNPNNLSYHLDGTSDNNSLYSSFATDTFADGKAGDDSIQLGAGNDTLIGGTGNDTMIGGAGNDTYIFNLGDGKDIINESGVSQNVSYGVDTIQFGAGISESDIYYSTNTSNGNDLVIKFRNSPNDQIIVQNQFAYEGYDQASNRVEYLKFTSQQTDQNGNPLFQTVDLANKDWSQVTFETNGSDGVDDYIRSTRSSNSISTGSGNDTVALNGGSGTNRVDAGSGDDTINGGNGNDTLIGGTGNDYISGSVGDDTYIFNLGDGVDTIVEGTGTNSGSDTMSFGAGITIDNIVSNKLGDDLVVTFTNSSADKLTFKDYFSSSSRQKIIEYAQFTVTNSDGTTTSQTVPFHYLLRYGTEGNDEITVSNGRASNFDDLINSYGGNDTINAGNGNDVIDAGNGDDSIIAGYGDDIITGGKGNDYIGGSEANYGDDTYIFNVGDGQDIITEYSGLSIGSYGNDVIQFGEGITQDNIYFSKSGDNLVINFRNSADDKITITNQILSYQGSKVETLKFSDGSTFSISNAATIPFEFQGTEGADNISGSIYNDVIFGGAGDDTLNGNNGDDTIYGEDGGDTITGGSGSDILNGGRGNDQITDNSGSETYFYNVGDGLDAIGDYGGGDSDKIVFGEGITQNDIYFTRSNDDVTLKFKNNDTDQITLLRQLYNPSGKVGIENLQFSDGSQLALNSDSLSFLFNGTEGNDNIDFASSYWNYGNVVNAGDGNDTIKTGQKNDVITAGKGNDTIYGGSGDDTYIYNKGDGSDVIIEVSGYGVSYGGSDTIKFGEGITQDEVYFSRDASNNLLIGFKDISDAVTIRNHFGSSSFRIENLKFSDGSTINLSDSSIILSNNTPYLSQSNNNFTVDGNQTLTIQLSDLLANAFDVEDGVNIQNISFDNIVISNATKITNPTDGSYYYQTASGKFTTDSTARTVIYTPDRNSDASDSFSYRIKDASGALSNIANINIAISHVNEAPEASLTSASGNEDNTLTIDVLASASDFDGDLLSISAVTNGSNGVATIVTDSNGKQQISYAPNVNFNGTDKFSYTISDGNGGTVTKELTVNVNAVNDAPIVVGSTQNQSAQSGKAFSYTLPSNLFSDVDGDNLTISATLADGSPLPSWLSFDGSKFSGTPNVPLTTNFAIKLTASDANGSSASSSFGINVTSSNSAPIARNDSYVTNEDKSVTISFASILANDSDVEDGINIKKISGDNIIFNNPTKGTIIKTATGIIYTPNKDYNGSDVITYQIKDSAGALSNVASINLTVKPVNDVAVADADSFVTNEDKSITIKLSDLLANDFDVEDGSAIQNLTMNKFVFSNPSKGVIVKDSVKGTITYTPNKNFNGDDSLTYQIKDSSGALSNKATISLTINAVNDAPIVATKLADQTAKAGNSFTYTLPTKAFSDVDNDVLFYSAKLSDGSDLPSWLSFDAATKTFSGTSPSGVANKLSIKVIASDGSLSASQNFNLAISSNVINGTAKNDSLNGTTSNDEIYGNGGVDTIKGNAGNDLIIGGKGADVLYGGFGNDQFIFKNLNESTNGASDLIMDFIRGEDKINLSDLGFDSISNGLGSAYSSHGLEYYFDGKNTVIDDPNSNFAVKLVGDIKLDAGDVIF